MYARVVLGATKVSLLERCPQFRGVLIEGFHCIHIIISQVRKSVRSVMTLGGVVLPVTAVTAMLGHSVELGAPTAHCVTRGPSPSESVVSFPSGNDDVTSCGD